MKGKLKKTLFLIAVLLVAGIAGFLLSPLVSQKAEGPNLIVFTLDTTRADYVDTGKGALAQTPVLKELAQKSTVFEKAYTTIPITMPAHTSIFTGLYPFEAGVFNNSETYEGKTKTLAEYLKEKGYKTGAVVSLGVLASQFGLSRGFDYYLDKFPEGENHYFLPGNVVTERGLSLLEKFGEGPFFLWLHYSDPHEPYAPPEYFKDKVKISLNGKPFYTYSFFGVGIHELELPLKKGENIIKFDFSGVREGYSRKTILLLKETSPDMKLLFEGAKEIKPGRIARLPVSPKLRRYRVSSSTVLKIYVPEDGTYKIKFKTTPVLLMDQKRRLYREEVEYMDRQIGRIIAYLKSRGLDKKTVMLFVGDHGEGLGEYKLNFGHIHFLEQQYIRVPMILYVPGKKPKRITQPVSVVDIMPMLAQVMGFKIKGKIDGKNPLKEKRKLVLAFTYPPESHFWAVSVQESDIQYIRYIKPHRFEELFDISKDRGYRPEENRAGEKEYIKALLRLRKVVDRLERLTARGDKKRHLSPETRRMLESLGYL